MSTNFLAKETMDNRGFFMILKGSWRPPNSSTLGEMFKKGKNRDKFVIGKCSTSMHT